MASEPIRFETSFTFSAREPEFVSLVEPSDKLVRAEFQAANEIRFGLHRFSLQVAVQISAS